jgi:hypothetical protein
MLYKLTSSQENELLHQPETGMGYQIIEANKQGNYAREKYLVLYSEIVIEMNASTSDNVRKVINEGIFTCKASASIIALNAIAVLHEKQFRNIVNESESKNGAIENPIVVADGHEVFIRLSAFDNDRRVDKVNMCLRAGTFTTTMEDYLMCKNTSDDPVERYALPNNDKIQFAFLIQPIKTDTLQRGLVQAANEKRGGGKEVYFAKGTAAGTFKQQTPY